MTEYTLLCTLRDQDTNVYIPIQRVSPLYSNSLDTDDDDDGKMQCQDKEMRRIIGFVLHIIRCVLPLCYVNLLFSSIT